MQQPRAFAGFGDDDSATAMPDSIFLELVREIQDLAELKIVLYVVWRLQHTSNERRFLNAQDALQADLGLEHDAARTALQNAVRHGILVRAGNNDATYYMLNSPSGRALAEALESGTAPDGLGPSQAPLERPNVFRLYEENIGSLTPLIADALKDAESTYPAGWIAEAVEQAVRNNKRSWSYCEAILRRWKEEGRGAKQDRRDDQTARQRDVEEKIRRFLRG